MVDIRLAKQNDAEMMLSIQKEAIAEGTFLLATEEEFTQTVEGLKAFIKEKQENPLEVIFVAEDGQQVIGWLVFQSHGFIRVQHSGVFAMMVQRDARGQGVGKHLLAALLKWAEEHPIIEKVCLGVFSSNEGAIGLYRKFGFEEEGRKIREIKLGSQYVDDVLMYKFVSSKTKQ